MAVDKGGPDAAERQDMACTDAHAGPPEPAEYSLATTGQTSDPEIVTVHQPGAVDGPPTSNINPDISEPVNTTTGEDMRLNDLYIEDMLRKRGRDEEEIVGVMSMMQTIVSGLKASGFKLSKNDYMRNLEALLRLPK